MKRMKAACICQALHFLKEDLAHDDAISHSLHHLPAGGCPLQHRRPDLHCQRQLSRLLWQRCQYGGLPADGGKPQGIGLPGM